MNTRRVCRTMMLLFILVGTNANAQKLTEQYIPIGKSPGLSGKVTMVGTVVEVDAKRKTLTCTDGSTTFTVLTDKSTKVWLDRSRQQLSNTVASLASCEKDQIVEVKFRNNERRSGAVAEWIKIEAKSP